jgi:hypothetical protein
VLDTALGAGLSKKVLGNLEPSCRLRRSEPWLVVAFLLPIERRVADHRLTKILVLP